MQKEIWKPIEGYGRLYEVSNMGKVKVLESFNKRNNHGKMVIYHQKEIIRKVGLASSGYALITLRKNGKTKSFLLHRIVAKAFISNPENKPNVNHIDNDPANNATSNLEWVTQKENYAHSERQGRNTFGERSGVSKLKEVDVLKIREMYRSGSLKADIANIFSITTANVVYIVSRKTWKHI